MDQTKALEAKLMTLTSRQCKILFWICQRQGIQVRELARHFHVSPQAIHWDIGKIYELFGLTLIKNVHEKRRILEEQVCPVHTNLVANPDLSCDDRIFIRGEPPPPSRATMQMVKRDLASGFFDPPAPPWKPRSGPGNGAPTSNRGERDGTPTLNRWFPILSLGLLLLILIALLVVIVLLGRLVLKP